MKIKEQLSKINVDVDNGLLYNFIENKYDTFESDVEALLHLVLEMNKQHLQMKQEYLKVYKQLQES